jgi:uncharacterized protein (DUF302 family)
LKQKLDTDTKKYAMLGACAHASVHKAIETEENIGLILPSNFIVYGKGDDVVISAIISQNGAGR